MPKWYAYIQIILSVYFFASFILYMPDWGSPFKGSTLPGIIGPLYSWANLIVVLSWYTFWAVKGS